MANDDSSLGGNAITKGRGMKKFGRKRKRYGSRNGMRQGIRGRDPIQNSRVNPQLQVMKILGEFLTAACQENLCCPLEADGSNIYLRLHSKGECIRS